MSTHIQISMSIMMLFGGFMKWPRYVAPSKGGTGGQRAPFMCLNNICTDYCGHHRCQAGLFRQPFYSQAVGHIFARVRM